MDLDRSKIAHDEYEMECLDTHSFMIADCIYETMIRDVHKNCDKLAKSLEHYLKDEETKISISEIKHDMKQLYATKIKPYALKIQEILDNLFRIPDNILLPKDAKQKVQYSKTNLNFLTTNHAALILKLEKAKIFQAALKRELECQLVSNELNNYDSVIEKLHQCMTVKSKVIKSDPSDLDNLQKMVKEMKYLTLKTEKDLYNPKIDPKHLKKIDFNDL